MAKKRYTYFSQPGKRLTNLDSIPDTSETEPENQPSSISRQDEYDEHVKVSPPFKGDHRNRAITWADLGYTYKVVAIVGGLFLAVGAPTIWFASKMSTKVDNIETAVHEIKQTTESLTSATIRNTSKIENIEKFLSTLDSRANSNNPAVQGQSQHLAK